jgi:hypothetical protein
MTAITPTRSAARIEGRRKQAFPPKRDLLWPDLDSYVPRNGDDSYPRQVYSHLCSYALRWLNTTQDKPMTLAEIKAAAQQHTTLAQRVAEMLQEYVEVEHHDVIIYDLEPGAVRESRLLGIRYSDLERMCADGGAFAAEVWDPNRTRRLAEAGRKGGEKSVMPRKYKPELLDQYLGMSKAEQRQMLGVSDGTIAAMRRDHPYYAKKKIQDPEPTPES